MFFITCLCFFFLYVLAGRFFLVHERLLIFSCGIDIVLFQMYIQQWHNSNADNMNVSYIITINHSLPIVNYYLQFP